MAAITICSDFGHTHNVYRFHTKILKKKPLTTINESIKVAGYKVNTQKSVEFLNTNNEENNSMYNSIHKNT